MVRKKLWCVFSVIIFVILFIPIWDVEASAPSINTLSNDTATPKLFPAQEYDGLQLKDNHLLIEGYVYDYSILSLNAVILEPAEDGYFSYEVVLHEGVNEFVLGAIDVAGNSVFYDFDVTVLPKNHHAPIIILVFFLVLTLSGDIYLVVKRKHPDSRVFPKNRITAWLDSHIRIVLPYARCMAFSVFLLTYIFEVGHVVSESMAPYIEVNDLYIGMRIGTKIDRQDIITFHRDGEVLVKRVIGVGGDDISFRNGKVYVNGNRLNEHTYLSENTQTLCASTFIVPDGEYFVLGDNRQKSYDSRFWAYPYVKSDDIIAECKVILPWHKITDMVHK